MSSLSERRPDAFSRSEVVDILSVTPDELVNR